ncbi:MAG: ABC transporter permease [Bacteroidia bacterium]|nr:ABC transporter permease [Bacteroidia bacterium]
MISKLIADIAKTLLIARWKQTLVAAIGVTFSITMFISLLSFMTGLNTLLDNLILNRTPHIKLYNDIKPSENSPIDQSEKYSKTHNFISSVKVKNRDINIYNSEAIINALKKDNRIKGIAPKVISQVFFNTGQTVLAGVINGIDAEAERKLFHFDDYITKGNAIDLKNTSNSIILGNVLAEKLLVKIGDLIQITTQNGEIFSLKLVGIFQSGLRDFDKTQSFSSINTVQKILGKTNNYITDIQIKLYDVNTAPLLAKDFHNTFEIDAEDIQTANAQFETGSKIRTIISYSVGITLLIVAGFGIYNILNMMIYEKMDSIAILKATGFSGKDVKNIFLTIALGIGFFGGMLGLVFGFLLSSIIDQIPFKTSALPTITTFPINYNLNFYLIAFLFSLVTTYFAGYFPAKKASKIDPVVIIRGK